MPIWSQFTFTVQNNFTVPTTRQPLIGHGLLTVEALRSHSDTPHSVRLLWTSKKPS